MTTPTETTPTASPVELYVLPYWDGVGFDIIERQFAEATAADVAAKHPGKSFAVRPATHEDARKLRAYLLAVDKYTHEIEMVDGAPRSRPSEGSPAVWTPCQITADGSGMTDNVRVEIEGVEPFWTERKNVRSTHHGKGVERCWYGCKTFAAAQAIAKLLNDCDPIAAKGFEALAKIGFHADVFLAADAGPGVSPRYSVFRAPSVGDECSYGFNGDAYPDGRILSIGTGPKARLVTSGENGVSHVYYRRKLSQSWVQQGGTWSLIHGRHDRRNPSF
jgi:hypothetical protein